MIVNISDWNMSDKYYDAPEEIVKEFKRLIETHKNERHEMPRAAWAWWCNQIDWGFETTKGRSVKYLYVPETDVFLDWHEPQKSIEEWDI